eukprot:m.838661 g.838661  ORF g.838661 m.838661 type:complete len:836 (-) comp23463_c0_seq5:1378-3885(-)
MELRAWIVLVAVSTLSVGLLAAPPSYPFRNTSLPVNERVKDLVSRLTLEEKTLQMTRGGAAKNCPTPAIARLGIAAHVWGTECASGLGSDDSSIAGTTFPQGLGLAATFDEVLVENVGVALHTELRAQHNEDAKNGVVAYHHGINCWSPVVNIMRHWAWGRNDETYGECPALSGALAKAYIRGLQGNNSKYVAATAGCKHFDVHGGPDATRRTFDANVTQRDWATTFLPAFHSCVEAGGLGMMCAMSSIRGTPACANHRAMTAWARDRWGYEGYIVSDQGSAYGIMTDHKYTHTMPETAAVAVRAGLDLEDANEASQTAFSGLVDAVKQGLLSESADIDKSVSRLFYVRMRTGEFDPADHNPYRQIPPSEIRSATHLNLTRVAATKSIVLLKNADTSTGEARVGVLPFNPASYSDVAVVGPFGDCQSCMFGKYSAHMEESKAVTIAGAINGTVGGTVVVVDGCTDGPACQHYDHAAVSTAVATPGIKAVVIAVGLGSHFETEGKDRPDMNLPGQQNQLVQDAIAAARTRNVPAIVVFFVAGPVSLNVTEGAVAMLNVFYPGEMGGKAVADVLFGAVSPAGRLPFSWPTGPDDVPPETDYTMQGRTYRYGQVNVARPFGYGLSYTTFTYSGLQLSASTVRPCQGTSVSVMVKNTGSVVADEVVQVYLAWDDVTPSTPTPVRQIAAFARVRDIAPGEQRQVQLDIAASAMAVLTDPACAAAVPNVRLQRPYASHAATSTPTACCALCEQDSDKCEAWTHDSSNSTCTLHIAWAFAESSAAADGSVLSAEVIPSWVFRPSHMTVSVGGQQPQQTVALPSNVLTASLALSGPETPVAQC